MYAFVLGAAAAAECEQKPFDTRSFIMSRPVLEEPPVRSPQQVQSALLRTVQARYSYGLRFY